MTDIKKNKWYFTTILSVFTLGLLLGNLSTGFVGGSLSSNFSSGTNTFTGSFNLSTLKSLDIDGDGQVKLNDAGIISRYLFGSKYYDNLTSHLTTNSNKQMIQHLDAIKTKLDVDGDGKSDALSDGLILSRVIAYTEYGLQVNDSNILRGVLSNNSTRKTLQQIHSYINDNLTEELNINEIQIDLSQLPLLDVDGDGAVKVNDAGMIIRYLFGFNNYNNLRNILTQRSDSEITQYLDSIKTKLDIDNDGKSDALSDGLILTRIITYTEYGMNLEDQNVLSGVLSTGAQRRSLERIVDYINLSFQ